MASLHAMSEWFSRVALRLSTKGAFSLPTFQIKNRLTRCNFLFFHCSISPMKEMFFFYKYVSSFVFFPRFVIFATIFKFYIYNASMNRKITRTKGVEWKGGLNAEKLLTSTSPDKSPNRLLYTFIYNYMKRCSGWEQYLPKKFCGEKFLEKRKLLIFAMAEKRSNAVGKGENRIQNYI